MANEIDKTIEELEAEVRAELEEANGADAPKKSAVPAEKMDKAEGEVQDTGSAVVSPTQGDAPAKKVAGAAKEVSGDAQQKGEGKPDAMSKAKEAGKNKSLAAGYEAEGEENLVEMEDPDDMKEEMPKTKSGMMDKINAEMKIMSKKDLAMAYERMMLDMRMSPEEMKKDEEMKDDEDDKMKKEAVEKRIKEVDVSEHVDALMNGEGDLSEEFKRKAATVFEAAVKSKIRDEVSRLEDEYKSELDESIKTTKEELSEKVDTYLNYVVEEWMKENELAIERGLKGEIAEDFISGLKTLFEDHYVDIPDEKYDVLEAQSEKITELEKKLNEEMGKVIDLKNSNSTLVREQVISETTTDLTDTEIEKFKSLTEDVEFTDGESFKEKLDTLKESYFPKTKPVETKTVNDVETGTAQDIDTTDSMASYMKAIGKLDK